MTDTMRAVDKVMSIFEMEAAFKEAEDAWYAAARRAERYMDDHQGDVAGWLLLEKERHELLAKAATMGAYLDAIKKGANNV